MLRALAGEPVVSAEPAGEGDGSEEGGRLGLLGLHRLYRPNPDPYFCPAQTLYTVQGRGLQEPPAPSALLKSLLSSSSLFLHLTFPVADPAGRFPGRDHSAPPHR